MVFLIKLTYLLVIVSFIEACNKCGREEEIILNCYGKYFHCINGTHFYQCGDYGPVTLAFSSQNILECAQGLICSDANNVECVKPSESSTTTECPPEETSTVTTTTVSVSDLTHDEKHMNITHATSSLLNSVTNSIETITQTTVPKTTKSSDTSEELTTQYEDTTNHTSELPVTTNTAKITRSSLNENTISFTGETGKTMINSASKTTDASIITKMFSSIEASTSTDSIISNDNSNQSFTETDRADSFTKSLELLTTVGNESSEKVTTNSEVTTSKSPIQTSNSSSQPSTHARSDHTTSETTHITYSSSINMIEDHTDTTNEQANSNDHTSAKEEESSSSSISYSTTEFFTSTSSDSLPLASTNSIRISTTSDNDENVSKTNPSFTVETTNARSQSITSESYTSTNTNTEIPTGNVTDVFDESTDLTNKSFQSDTTTEDNITLSTKNSPKPKTSDYITVSGIDTSSPSQSSTDEHISQTNSDLSFEIKTSTVGLSGPTDKKEEEITLENFFTNYSSTFTSAEGEMTDKKITTTSDLSTNQDASSQSSAITNAETTSTSELNSGRSSFMSTQSSPFNTDSILDSSSILVISSESSLAEDVDLFTATHVPTIEAIDQNSTRSAPKTMVTKILPPKSSNVTNISSLTDSTTELYISGKNEDDYFTSSTSPSSIADIDFSFTDRETTTIFSLNHETDIVDSSDSTLSTGTTPSSSSTQVDITSFSSLESSAFSSSESFVSLITTENVGESGSNSNLQTETSPSRPIKFSDITENRFIDDYSKSTIADIVSGSMKTTVTESTTSGSPQLSTGAGTHISFEKSTQFYTDTSTEKESINSSSSNSTNEADLTTSMAHEYTTTKISSPNNDSISYSSSESFPVITSESLLTEKYDFLTNNTQFTNVIGTNDTNSRSLTETETTTAKPIDSDMTRLFSSTSTTFSEDKSFSEKESSTIELTNEYYHTSPLQKEVSSVQMREFSSVTKDANIIHSSTEIDILEATENNASTVEKFATDQNNQETTITSAFETRKPDKSSLTERSTSGSSQFFTMNSDQISSEESSISEITFTSRALVDISTGTSNSESSKSTDNITIDNEDTPRNQSLTKADSFTKSYEFTTTIAYGSPENVTTNSEVTNSIIPIEKSTSSSQPSTEALSDFTTTTHNNIESSSSRDFTEDHTVMTDGLISSEEAETSSSSISYSTTESLTVSSSSSSTVMPTSSITINITSDVNKNITITTQPFTAETINAIGQSIIPESYTTTSINIGIPTGSVEPSDLKNKTLHSDTTTKENHITTSATNNKSATLKETATSTVLPEFPDLTTFVDFTVLSTEFNTVEINVNTSSTSVPTSSEVNRTEKKQPSGKYESTTTELGNDYYSISTLENEVSIVEARESSTTKGEIMYPSTKINIVDVTENTASSIGQIATDLTNQETAVTSGFNTRKADVSSSSATSLIIESSSSGSSQFSPVDHEHTSSEGSLISESTHTSQALADLNTGLTDDQNNYTTWTSPVSQSSVVKSSESSVTEKHESTTNVHSPFTEAENEKSITSLQPAVTTLNSSADISTGHSTVEANEETVPITQTYSITEVEVAHQETSTTTQLSTTNIDKSSESTSRESYTIGSSQFSSVTSVDSFPEESTESTTDEAAFSETIIESNPVNQSVTNKLKSGTTSSSALGDSTLTPIEFSETKSNNSSPNNQSPTTVILNEVTSNSHLKTDIFTLAPKKSSVVTESGSFNDSTIGITNEIARITMQYPSNQANIDSSSAISFNTEDSISGSSTSSTEITNQISPEESTELDFNESRSTSTELTKFTTAFVSTTRTPSISESTIISFVSSSTDNLHSFTHTYSQTTEATKSSNNQKDSEFSSETSTIVPRKSSDGINILSTTEKNEKTSFTDWSTSSELVDTDLDVSGSSASSFPTESFTTESSLSYDDSVDYNYSQESKESVSSTKVLSSKESTTTSQLSTNQADIDTSSAEGYTSKSSLYSTATGNHKYPEGGFSTSADTAVHTTEAISKNSLTRTTLTSTLAESVSMSTNKASETTDQSSTDLVDIDMSSDTSLITSEPFTSTTLTNNHSSTGESTDFVEAATTKGESSSKSNSSATDSVESTNGPSINPSFTNGGISDSSQTTTPSVISSKSSLTGSHDSTFQTTEAIRSTKSRRVPEFTSETSTVVPQKSSDEINISSTTEKSEGTSSTDWSTSSKLVDTDLALSGSSASSFSTKRSTTESSHSHTDNVDHNSSEESRETQITSQSSTNQADIGTSLAEDYTSGSSLYSTVTGDHISPEGGFFTSTFPDHITDITDNKNDYITQSSSFNYHTTYPASESSMVKSSKSLLTTKQGSPMNTQTSATETINAASPKSSSEASKYSSQDESTKFSTTTEAIFKKETVREHATHQVTSQVNTSSTFPVTVETSSLSSTETFEKEFTYFSTESSTNEITVEDQRIFDLETESPKIETQKYSDDTEVHTTGAIRTNSPTRSTLTSTLAESVSLSTNEAFKATDQSSTDQADISSDTSFITNNHGSAGGPTDFVKAATTSTDSVEFTTGPSNTSSSDNDEISDFSQTSTSSVISFKSSSTDNDDSLTSTGSSEAEISTVPSTKSFSVTNIFSSTKSTVEMNTVGENEVSFSTEISSSSTSREVDWNYTTTKNVSLDDTTNIESLTSVASQYSTETVVSRSSEASTKLKTDAIDVEVSTGSFSSKETIFPQSFNPSEMNIQNISTSSLAPEIKNFTEASTEVKTSLSDSETIFTDKFSAGEDSGESSITSSSTEEVTSTETNVFTEISSDTSFSVEETSTTSQFSTGLPSVKFKCLQPGKFPDTQDCNEYHLCVDLLGDLIDLRGECPRGTLFDPNSLTCTTSPVQCPGELQLNCSTEGIFAHPTKCSRYYSCSWNYIYIKYDLKQYLCPPQQQYDEAEESCIDSTECISDNGEAFICTDVGYFPVEYNCRNFYHCDIQNNSSLTQTVKTCGGNALFDRVRRKCRIACLVTNCPYNSIDIE